MSEFSITCFDFNDGEEIPKRCGYKHGNEQPPLLLNPVSDETTAFALIMDDPDAMAAVGKVWIHWLFYFNAKNGEYPYDLAQVGGAVVTKDDTYVIHGKTDFGEIGYGGPAPPDKRHTYIFKAYALDTKLDLKEGYSKQELEDAMKGHIIAEAKLTGTFAP